MPGELRSVLCLLGALPGVARAQQPPSPWAFGPFHKPRAVNPVIAPDPSATFRSPTNDSLVRWEEHATFNPAAVVKDGTVYVLYRAEDASGDREIGHHTSRIGLACTTASKISGAFFESFTFLPFLSRSTRSTFTVSGS